ncbi:Bug family tripartite tricarboxylate transporter substrate binding protein [Achromobacter xylosoxidans]|jgi:tripartite-type tricarboxylate transporter receptor subunit TctC|uniref:Tripartite tricarboxylate transporter substrate binding protein n=2 Tax=Alcaligenes xylosoxydans xylosoxydans TaxID=85698 RepID=A0A0D6HMM8_ALCXX|nr:tripartite tricarboxylate transporter substrate binding protein [Achromobacter xylosoxidans]AHC47434.1 putative exported protein [Achromobacter xylosoxidans NBRC 15126 = ATCC 27061]KOQ18182.1 ABC transporter substrate-binding protein [Achromobacter xylosoxidans]KOQ20691.1 ABC transporter substrate-binding protein [Achromobacter xylosoxidans]KOQ30980.1 ABC transporter substrate-binding protein [Achromobacter xylosoxidans]KOQ39878.1 ABC transporter substrate-binding protein [Achromobacter xyl
MDSNRRQLLLGAAALGASHWAPAWAQADAWPTRPVRIVVPYPPGGSSDIIARVIAPRLAEALRQTVVVENKPGANGNLGAGIVVQSAQEGHTVLLCDVGALAISPSVYTKLSFDPSKDLRAVGMLAYSPHVLAVHPDVPARTVPELVALSKKQRLNFAVTAIGSAPHLAAVAVQQATGAQWEYVPYKGGSQAVTDTIGGQTQVIMNGLLATLPHIKGGKLRAIAISKKERMQLVADIPTISEQGVAGFESGTWQGVMAPAATTDKTANLLATLMGQIVNQPDVKSQLNEQGAEIVVRDPAQLAQFFNSERARWAKVVQSADIRLD